ncbi:MAG: (4Fe-4S)-binding protein [Candidatus Goldiibacteriota bacterium HGW-Goldbacteria-1]|jgi:Pyruvate/2-oxoacid:ferredoxin oxidoreductase delta subunit|nr:MAG: (4Fe-4S)-binding protein [Candidatus Goldiibacteriota bacterium HGW-Goldbacteria-1]
MSGTGNSFKTAVWAGEKLKEHGCAASVIPMEKASLKNNPPSDNNLTGIFTPTHAFTAAWPAIKFAFMMPRVKKAPAIIIATRAGAYYGPLPLPGMEGTACLIIALILLLKGYDIRGFAGMDMPTNWLALHWGMTEKHAQYFYDKTKREISAFMDTVASGRRIFKGIPSWIMGLTFLPVSFAYLIAGRLMLSKVMFADEKCTSCGICAANCPYGAIIMKGEKIKKPYWTFKCESCERCIAYCPEKSIQAAHSYLVIVCWLLFGAVTAAVQQVIIQNPVFNNEFASMIFMLISSLGLFFVCYWALYLITRFKPFAWLFSHTTFTKIFRRYHQSDVTLRDLKNGK